MRLVLGFLLTCTLVAQEGQLIPKEARKDVSAFAFSDGKTTRTIAQLKGKVVLVDFWACLLYTSPSPRD